MGYFLINDHCKNTNQSQAIITTRARNYAAMLMAFQNKHQATKIHTFSRYLNFAKNMFGLKHQVIIRTNFPFFPYAFSGASSVKRFITIMWATTLGHGFPMALRCQQRNFNIEMDLMFFDGYNVRVKFLKHHLSKGHKPIFQYFTGSNYHNSYGICFNNLRINSNVTLDIYDPSDVGKKCDCTDDWKIFLDFIKGVVAINNYFKKTIHINNKRIVVNACNIDGVIFGYTDNQNFNFSNDFYTLINGFYIEESEE